MACIYFVILYNDKFKCVIKFINKNMTLFNTFLRDGMRSVNPNNHLLQMTYHCSFD